MKDYKLSEIKAICKKNIYSCKCCPICNCCYELFGDKIPSEWQIDEEEQDDDGE